MQDQSLPPFDVCVQSSELAVREALAEISRGLGPLELNPEEAGIVELVLAEALNNIVEHAYAPSYGCGPIRIECLHKSDGLHLRIRDCGATMPGDKAPPGIAADLGKCLKDLPEGGFGWFLIKDLAEDVKYRRINGENCLDLRLAVAVQ